MKYLRAFVSMYRPRFAETLVYMLQGVEYQVGPYIAWLRRTHDFSAVMYRRQLDHTKAARLLLLALWLGITIQVAAGIALIIMGVQGDIIGGVGFGAALIIAYPLVWAYVLVVPLIVGRELIAKPAEAKLIAESKAIFASHKGIKIAVAGSYGKTSMKDLLVTILGEGLDVAATPGNKNVSVSHARFAQKLTGKEDVLIIEYGEGQPGDVAHFAAITQPTHAIITGIAPAHLDRYPTLKAAAEDIFSVADAVPADHVYVNSDSPDATPFIKKGFQSYNVTGALGWSVQKIRVVISGTSFELHKGKHALKLQSGLIGKHQIASLALVAALAHELGLSDKQIEDGIAKTVPYEHRMQPYQLGGAWVVDDTYNGNLEGLRAGTALLATLGARRKVYVTPGLVDQGVETERVHVTAGELIAAAKPDEVVLMKNSTTSFIIEGLSKAHFKGELRVESDPLDFYTNLQHFVAAGDLIVMQNDWTDNYA
jgi:UDP-N-acetylmuramyl pentapeptide synthase